VQTAMTFADFVLMRYWNVPIGVPANAQVP